MSRLTLLRPSDYQRVRWKNDGGWTTEIAREPADANTAFDWRISIADIESDGPFSNFPGVDRDLILLAGNGIELDIDDAPPLRLVERFARVHFAGESNIGCRLLAGATRDFNVMVRRDAVRAEVVARPLLGSMVIFPESGAEWLVHVLAGEAHARTSHENIALETGSSLRIRFDGAEPTRVVLEGGGELVLVKFVMIASR
ncbi:MAG: HutD/Ves family protein [Rhodanobacteraceae bacterium]